VQAAGVRDIEVEIRATRLEPTDRRKAKFYRRLYVFIGAQDMCFFRPIRKSKPYGPPMNADKRRSKKVIRQLA
jgi:hypothetical protein